MVWLFLFFFFFNDTATTEIYTLSLHDALPISHLRRLALERPLLLLRGARFLRGFARRAVGAGALALRKEPGRHPRRSEEHTSELQSRQYLVCRLLLEKKKNI